MGVLALVEHSDGRPDRLSLEALAMARTLEAEWGPLHAVLFEAGAGEAGAAEAAGSAAEAAAVLDAMGISSASLVAHEALTDYAPAAWGAALAQLVRERGDRAVVAAGSDRGNEVLAHMAARADLPMVADCTELRPGDPLGITRQRWAGGLLEDCLLDAPVAVLSVAPHAVEPAEVGAGADTAGAEAGAGSVAVSTFEPVLADADLVARVVRREAPEVGRLSLADARVVVGGGRGVGGAEGFAALEELAGLLGGTVGVSRAVTSAGWRPHSEQVGQTGVRIAPDVYIACGISGAIQHIVGCKAARQIIVINSDPEAPILERASHAVIGDLRTIVPAISQEIRRTRSG